MSEAEAAAAGGSAGEKQEQDQFRFLPIANIAHVMRGAAPKNGKIAKDAKESVQECVSEFIAFITSVATEKCKKERRKIINGDDIIESLATLGFHEYVEPLALYLDKYQEAVPKGLNFSDDLNGEKQNLLNGYPASLKAEADTKGSKSSNDHNGEKHNLLNGYPASLFDGMYDGEKWK